MSSHPSGNRLPSSYSLPPPPPSSTGKGKGRGRGKGRGSGRFQPLFRQNNQPGLNQQNSQLFGSTYSDKIINDEQLLSNIEKNEVSHKLDLPQTPSKKKNKNIPLKSSNGYKKLIDNYSPQEQFASLLDSFSKSIFDNMQNLQKSFEEKYSILHRPNNNSSDKYQNLSILNESQESLNEKGKRLNVNDQFCSNFSQTKQPVGQNSKVTSSCLPSTSSSQLKKQKQASPNNEQGSSVHDKDYQVNFAAVAKAALAATSALQYKGQSVDDKHNNAKDCKSNSQR